MGEGAPAHAPGAVLVASEHYRRPHYGANHPLAIPRVSLTLDLIRAQGAVNPDEWHPGRPAARDELTEFHTEDYVAALARAEVFGGVRDGDRRRHGLGTAENPWFPGVYFAPALATGSSLVGAEAVLGGQRAFSPAGGMHHARPDRACGFCYFNDAVLAILRLRAGGLRVLYVDLDAHHGDGVEEAFWNDPDVCTLSFHMSTEYSYPFRGGAIGDQGGPQGDCACVNVPLPAGVHDGEYAALFGPVWSALCADFRPDVVVVQAGTDGLFADPLGRLRLSTEGFLRTVQQIVTDSPRLLVIGGGGYHPLLLARCWAGVWALLSGRPWPVDFGPEAEALLRSVDWDLDEDEPYFTTLFTGPCDRLATEPVRPEIEALLARLAAEHPRLACL